MRKSDAEAPLIRPEFFARFFRRVEPTLLVCFDEKSLKSFLQKGAFEKERKIIGMPYHKMKDAEAGIALVGIGAPSAAIGVEMLIALGANRIIFFGSAGAMDEKLDIGDVCLCTRAISDDGTSRSYIPDKQIFSASEKLTAELKTSLKTSKEITVFTTDAFFMETPIKIKKFSMLGAQAVEMEAACIFAIAEHKGVEAAGVLLISDLFTDKGWTAGFWKPRFRLQARTAREKLLRWLSKNAIKRG